MAESLTPVTVVTVVYNAVNDIERTIRSVLAQTHVPLEYIVIDGGSTDGTVERIRRHAKGLARLVSEPDLGIYDAMNKASAMATGDYINFMNAGDVFAADDVVAKMLAPDHQGYDFIYGEHIYDNGVRRFHVKTRPLEQMWQRISFCHQSLFTRLALQLERPFDLRWRVVSDYAFYFACYQEGHRFLGRDFPVAVFQGGGLSDRLFLRRTYERWRVVRRFRNRPSTHWYYLCLMFEHLVMRIKKHLGRIA